ncbi:MAG TPA: alkaline phosphatase [Kiritimatiellia bacterium]|nr:alkaline phosphatase [Kiritimatiellia bacterium]
MPMSRMSFHRVAICFALLLATRAILAPAAPFLPLSLTDAANTGFSDVEEGDRKGGWLDLGGNDLSVLPAGLLTVSSRLPFQILDSKKNPDRTCVVLGGPKRPYLPSRAEIRVDGKTGAVLYLLHGAAWCPPPQQQKMAGVLTVEYADGTGKEYHVRCGRDVGDWTKPDSYSNAARVWSAYNANTQVSLFASKFKLEAKPIRLIRLRSQECAWMVVAATLGDEISIKPIRRNLTLDKKYTAPPPFEKPLRDDLSDTRPKNIILIIGDGMGEGAQKLTSLYQHKAEGRLAMQQLPVTGYLTTFSANSEVTDSAASSTAIACGHKTNNGMLGLTPQTNTVLSVAALARESGRAVAILTSDAVTGATPSGFYAHVVRRGAYSDIAEFAAACGYDMLIGNANARAWFTPEAAGGQRTDTRNVLNEMTAAGYAVVTNAALFAAVPEGQRVVGFLDKPTLEPKTALGTLMDIALPRLARHDKGFFMMMECTITDAGGHGNNPEYTVRGTLQVDWAVRRAVDFAKSRGDTLVLVTADHETGGLFCSLSRAVPDRLTICYTTTSHTGAPVPIHAFGPGSKYFQGMNDNTDIAKTVAFLWRMRLSAPTR